MVIVLQLYSIINNYLCISSQCIEKVGRGCLSLDQAKQLFHVLDGALVGHFANQLRREGNRLYFNIILCQPSQ